MMLYLKIKLLLYFCVLLGVEVLSKDIQRRSKRSDESNNEQNFNKNGTDDEKSELVSPLIMNVLDPNNNPIGDLRLRLNGITNSLAQNEAMLPNINILSNNPAQRGKLGSKAKNIKPSHNTSDDRNVRLSKHTSSRPKPKLDQASTKVSVPDSLSPNDILKKKENKHRRPLNSVNTQKEDKTLKDSTTDGEQSLNYEDIINSVKNNLNLRQFCLTEPQVRQRVIFDSNYGNEKNTDAITNECSDLMNQGANEKNDGGYNIERLTEVVLEQNNYLKQILQTILQRNNVTRKECFKSNNKRIHVILDVKDFGNKTVDIELKPIIKCEDNTNETRIKPPLTDNRNWVKINTSESDVYSDGIKKYILPETSDNHETRKSYLPYPYYNPILGVSNQAFIEYKPKKPQGSYFNNNDWQHNITPEKTNNIYLLRTDNKNTISKLSKIMAIDTPQCYYKTHFTAPTNNIRYYHGYLNHLPKSLPKMSL